MKKPELIQTDDISQFPNCLSRESGCIVLTEAKKRLRAYDFTFDEIRKLLTTSANNRRYLEK